jgi:hypothetical protein
LLASERLACGTADEGKNEWRMTNDETKAGTGLFFASFVIRHSAFGIASGGWDGTGYGRIAAGDVV